MSSRPDLNPYADSSSSPANLLLRDVEYRIDRTRFGEWRGFMYEDGKTFQEFTSHASIARIPLLHYTYGKCPETGRRKIARGIIAVGRIAVGIVAIGHASLGIIGIGQATFGFLLGIGQLAVGGTAVGQFAMGSVYAFGQFSLGYYSIGQFAVGVEPRGLFTWKLPGW